MKLEDGRITILIGQESTTIELRDNKACTVFAKITLNPEQLSMALSRLGSVPCDIEINELDRIGKTHENKYLEFPLPKGKSNYDIKKHELLELAAKNCPEGWVSDNYFNSRDSFFTKDGKNYARVTIRRWI